MLIDEMYNRLIDYVFGALNSDDTREIEKILSEDLDSLEFVEDICVIVIHRGWSQSQLLSYLMESQDRTIQELIKF